MQISKKNYMYQLLCAYHLGTQQVPIEEILFTNEARKGHAINIQQFSARL